MSHKTRQAIICCAQCRRCRSQCPYDMGISTVADGESAEVNLRIINAGRIVDA